MSIKRHLASQLDRYQDKLIFIYGPRQSGKTCLVENHLKPNWVLNMDSAADHHLSEFSSFKPAESVLVVEEPGIFTISNRHIVISIELLSACLE